ncbi:MAG: HDOD domain-containing protein [Spirochaetes bacterium]|nr:HDOD domain-containing protein [Spirochaetota bacterium]
MDNEELSKKIYSQIEELPLAIPRILELLDKTETSASDIVKVLTYDPTLTAKILKVANSAYYGFSTKVTKLETAVPLLGFNMIKSLALSMGVVSILPKEEIHTEYYSRSGIWKHSIAVATIIQELGKRYCKHDLNESLFIIGLLHDIGKIVLSRFFHKDFMEIIEFASTHKLVDLHVAERVVIGMDHCEVAGMLLKRWKFPETIIHPIEFHHIEELPEEVRENDVLLLRVANSLAQHSGFQMEGNAEPNKISENDLNKLKISESQFESMKSFVDDSNEKIKSLLASLL